MNTLYYVALYNHAKNAYTHFLLTAITANEAEQIALNALGAGWRVKSSTDVCATPDHVMTEV